MLQRAESKVAGDLRAGTASEVRGLYVIVDREATRGRPESQVAEAALRGGARVIQLRDKARDKGNVLPVARQIRSMCEGYDALFIVNDDPSLALLSGAHGLHVGQSDMPVPEARRVLASDQILGRSNNSLDEVAHSVSLGVDYLAIGAVFPTTSLGKIDRPAVGVEMVKRVKQIALQPVVAIGGINLGNVAEVVNAGADCICVVSAVTLAEDPEGAARALVRAIQNVKL